MWLNSRDFKINYIQDNDQLNILFYKRKIKSIIGQDINQNYLVKWFFIYWSIDIYYDLFYYLYCFGKNNNLLCPTLSPI